MVLAAILGLCAASALHAADPVETFTMDRLAPKDSWLVIGIDDVAASRERWNRTPVATWWQTEPIQKLVKEVLEKSQKESAERLRELGVSEDAWSAPTRVGGALYAKHDDELDSDQAHFILYGDWGDTADGVAAIFDAVLVDFEKTKPGRVKSVDIRGRRASAITVKPEEPKPEIGKDGRPRRPRPRRGGFFDEGSMFQHVETIWYVRDGSRFLLGSVEKDLDETLAAFEGLPHASVQDDPDFQASLDQVGRGDGWAVMLMAPMQRVAGVSGTQFGFLQPMLTAVFGELKAFGFAVSCDQPQSQLEVHSGICVKGDRAGVLALPNPAVPAKPPPKFVSADAMEYGVFQIQFRDVMKLLETIVSNLPEAMAANLDSTLQQYGPDLRKAFDAMGSDMHFFSLADKQPGSEAAPSQGAYVIRCNDENAVTGLMNLFLPEAGFEPRDFNGHTVFTSESDEQSFGFGGEMFFIGSTEVVEQCLRGGDGKLGDVPACRQSLEAVGSDPVIAWGYSDLVASLENSREELVAWATRVERGAVPKDQREIADQVGIGIPLNVVEELKEIDATSLSEAFGPMQWDVRPLPNGLLTRVRFLKPAASE